MKCILTAVALAAALDAVAVCTDVDSVNSRKLEETVILGNRAARNTPIAFTTLTKAQIENANHGQDIPYLLSMTPSAITTSDAGTGIGYTSLRIRGTDATRINVTANGIPLNDAESQAVFWVNLPDFASSLSDIQIQRGVGTSTNGAGAFGATVNMRTDKASPLPYGEVTASYGSFNTHKETVKIGSGLLRGHWTFDARLSDIGTDGYIDRANSRLHSFATQMGYYGNRTSAKLLVFGGKERTYHAWNYASKEDMDLYGRRYNSCGEYYDAEGNRHYYDDQTDNYIQTNVQLHIDHSFRNKAWRMNAALHYTKGDGYYQEYKPGRSLEEYGLKTFLANGETVKTSDLIRKKAMDNHFGGGLIAFSCVQRNLSLNFGAASNYYCGGHFGNVLWVKNYLGELAPNHKYYDNTGKKADNNIYVRADYGFKNGVNLFADLQYRRVDYRLSGTNDKYDWYSGGNIMQQLDIDECWNFFNPKAGVNWNINKNNRIFASVSMANREPSRNNFTDGKFTAHPKAERLVDYELGYTFRNGWLGTGVNFYFMDYKDQLVLTGELNEIGEAMADNVKRSYRTGIEFTLAMQPLKWLRWEANATWSRNRIRNFTETLYDDDYTPHTIRHGDMPIAFSPDWIAGSRLTFMHKGWRTALHTQAVSKQYMSNAKQEDCVLEAYCTTNLEADYTWQLRRLKNLTLGAVVYNLFNAKYENNGYAGSGLTEDAKGQLVRYNYSGYAAQAGIHGMVHLRMTF